MNERTNPIKNRLNEQLPSHSPDPGLWNSLSAKLDMIDANAALQEKLGELPLRSPDPSTWNSILFRLNRIAYYRTGMRIALSAAAGLLLFFTVSRIIEPNQTQVPTKTASFSPGIVNQASIPAEQPNNSIAQAVKTKNNKQVYTNKPTGSKAFVSGNTPLVTEKDATAGLQPALMPQDNNSIAAAEIPEAIAPSNAPVAEIAAVNEPAEVVAENYNINTGPRIVPPANVPVTSTGNPAVKYYTPDEPKTGKNKNYFALAMNYLPENVYNGTDNTVFHNVDLTASYNKEKVRYNTSLGMAYNEDQFKFDMNYDVKTPVTAPGPNGGIDTLGYSFSNVESEYQGTEKHQYITYNLGLGRRLFHTGKFSSWLNAGAGFGIQLNNPDLIGSTTQSIKGQQNTQINSVNTDKPQYNDYNINFVTGIDFNYQIIKRLSISFAPTSRWYFKPLIVKDNQPTDELSLGFTTGMKFDF